MASPFSIHRAAMMAAGVVLAVAHAAMAQPATTGYGVTTTNRLIAFNTASPGIIIRNVPITNLQPGETILGVDIRPANKLLYGLGSSNQLYIINHVSGAAIRIGAPFTPALQGTSFGFDFNPTVDRIRVVSNTGQNLRLHPDTVAVTVDGSLAYAPADANAGTPARVVAVGYTNPDTNPATGTTLFDIDAGLDLGAIQNPPNNGTLNTAIRFGVDTTDHVSLDFDTAGTAFIAAQLAGGTTSSLFQFVGGQGRFVGVIGGGELVTAFTVSLGEPITPPAGLVYGVTTANELFAFNPDTPSVILGRAPITNLTAGERMLGIDFRQGSNLLYGLGSSGQLYLIDGSNAMASKVGPPLATTLNGTEFGFDFNPTVDRIRVVSDAGQNLRLHPDTGAVAAVDTSLSFAPTDANAGRTPRVVAAAYTNPDTNPATGTTLFVLDSGLDIGAIQDPPNAGVLNTFAPLGIDAGDLVGFDIGRTRILFSVVPAGAGAPFLYDATAGIRFLGAIGTTDLVRDIAISLGR